MEHFSYIVRLFNSISLILCLKKIVPSQGVSGLIDFLSITLLELNFDDSLFYKNIFRNSNLKCIPAKHKCKCKIVQKLLSISSISTNTH